MAPIEWIVGLFALIVIFTIMVNLFEPAYLKFIDWILGTDKLADWEKNHQPLTDEEFLARCKPGTRRETALKVRAILADVSGISEERIHPDHRLIDDLKLY